MIPTPNEIFADPAASDWLKAALRAALKRDACDALNDAGLLADILAERFYQLTANNTGAKHTA